MRNNSLKIHVKYMENTCIQKYIFEIQYKRNKILTKFYDDNSTNMNSLDETKNFFTLQKCKINLPFNNNQDNPTYSGSIFCANDYNNFNSMKDWSLKYFKNLFNQLYHIKFYIDNCNIRLYFEESFIEYLINTKNIQELLLPFKESLKNAQEDLRKLEEDEDEDKNKRVDINNNIENLKRELNTKIDELGSI